MNELIVYQLDPNGYFAGDLIPDYGVTVADESPLEPGVYLMPAGCVKDAPPEPIEGKLRRYVSDKWIYEDKPVIKLVEPDTTAQAHLLKISILNDISALEAKQHRAVREYILGDRSEKVVAKALVKQIEEQIQSLRSRLVD